MPSTGAPWQFAGLAALMGYFESVPVVRCVGVARLSGSVRADQDATSVRRRIVGRSAAGLDPAPRGTQGLMPARWGVTVTANVQDDGSDYEIRTRSGKLISSGQTSGRLYLTSLMRMPRSQPLPARGEAFTFVWGGIPRAFVVWSAEEQWAVRSVRLVEITARHELDLGSRLPTAYTPTALTLS